MRFQKRAFLFPLVVTLRYVDATIGASDEEYSSTSRIYGSTLSCPFSHRLYHRHHPATGQSGILFSKLPRLNQRIALNGALLVIPPLSSLPAAPFRPFTHELFISSTQFCKGVRLSGSQSEIQVRIIIAFIARRAVKTASRYSRIKAMRKVASFPFKSLALRIHSPRNNMQNFLKFA